MARGKFVAYYRVSTDKQGQSGLGLEAQRQAVVGYLGGNGWELIGEYTEVESAKRTDNRPELDKAFAYCRATGATLIIAKLDRLSRDAHFLLGLQKNTGTPFVAVDLPEANELTIGIMAVVAQAERQMISKRTREALQAAKARGIKLGNPNGAAALRRWRERQGGRVDNTAGVEAVKRITAARTDDLRPIITAIRDQGIKTTRGIASELTRRGIVTPRGGAMWRASTVHRLLKRLG